MNNITEIFASTQIETRSTADRYYLYGDLDGLLNHKPNKEFWRNKPEYKQGYLDGFARRIENEFNGLEVV